MTRKRHEALYLTVRVDIEVPEGLRVDQFEELKDDIIDNMESEFRYNANGIRVVSADIQDFYTEDYANNY